MYVGVLQTVAALGGSVLRRVVLSADWWYGGKATHNCVTASRPHGPVAQHLTQNGIERGLFAQRIKQAPGGANRETKP